MRLRLNRDSAEYTPIYFAILPIFLYLWQIITKKIERYARSSLSAWNQRGDEKSDGTQVDMLILRDDNIVNLCEMKFADRIYSIDKEEEQKMLHRVEALKSTLNSRQTVHLTLVTTYGLAAGKHSGKVQKVVVADDLFSI